MIITGIQSLMTVADVMRACIQGESRLKSMPNNTVTMICFAASIALALSAPVPGKSGNQNLAPSIRHLIEDTATVLERIGSTPSHRNGSSVVYGRFLRVLLKQAPSADAPARPRIIDADPAIAEHERCNSLAESAATRPDSGRAQDPIASLWQEPLDFSAMSYNEVNETVTNSDLFSAAMLDLPWDSSNQLMWTDWLHLPDFTFP
jgi:hypothetical protein